MILRKIKRNMKFYKGIGEKRRERPKEINKDKKRDRGRVREREILTMQW